MGSPVSLDFGLPLSGDSQADLDQLIDGKGSRQGLVESPGTHDSSHNIFSGQMMSTRHGSSIDSAFDQDMLNQWSPSQEFPQGRTGSAVSAHLDAMEASQMADLNDNSKPPAWSELKTKAGKERKRLPLACIDCRRKKIKCSGEKPACKHCVRARVPCVYKNTARKAAPRTDYMAMLDKRLKRMEDRVIKMIPKDDPPDLNLTGRSSVRPPIPGQTVKKEKAAILKQGTDEAFSVEISEWTQPKKSTQELPAPFDRPQHEFENKLSTEGADALPSVQIQEHLAELFFDCVYGQSYLLLHKPSFLRRLKAGSVPPVLMLAVCAISARFSTHPQVSTEPAFLRGEQWATAARKIVEKRHFEPNITILTVMLILGLHFFGTCEGGLSWSFGGQSMRMGYALQLHRELDHDPLGRAQAEREASNGKKVPELQELSFTDREIRRRLMWACYLMDVFNSSGTERPSFLNEEYIKIQLPIKEACFQQETPGLTEDIEGHVTIPKDSQMQSEQAQTEAKSNLGVAAYIIRAVVVWKRIVQYLNLGGKEKDPHPIWDPLSQFASLQRQIQQLKKQLPDELKYNPENLAVHVLERLANQFLFLHIVIAHSSLFLHRFAIPTAPNVHRPYAPNTPKPFLAVSATTVVEAASTISKLLSESTGHTLTVPFAGYCAYTSATVHVWGIFSKHPGLEASSRDNLRHNYRYLTRMKRYWGMFHYMAESVKDIYRLFAEASNHSDNKLKVNSLSTRGRGISPGASLDSIISAEASRTASPSTGERKPSTTKSDETLQDAGSSTDSPKSSVKPILQYGDWFDRYPHGVSETEWETSHHPYKKESLRGNEAVMSQKSELQSVEEFFASLTPPSKAAAADKDRDAAIATGGTAVDDGGPTGRGKKIPRRRGKSVHENIKSGTGTTVATVSKSPSSQTQQQQQQQQQQQLKEREQQQQSQQQQQQRQKSQSMRSSTGGSATQYQTSNPITHQHFTGLQTMASGMSAGLDMNTSDIDIPMSDFGGPNTQQPLQSQAGTAFDLNATNSPSYFNPSGNFTSGLAPTTHRPSLDFEYNSPSSASNTGSASNQHPPQGQNHMNFNFNYTSALPHLDRQMVFGAYAGLDPSTSNGSSALNNPSNSDYWGMTWDGMGNDGSIDMDGFGAFDDMSMTGMDPGSIKSQNSGLLGTEMHNRFGAMQGGNRIRNGAFNGAGVGQNRQTNSAAEMSSSAWFMPFNIEPPVFPGLEDFGLLKSMDSAGPGGGMANNNNDDNAGI